MLSVRTGATTAERVRVAKAMRDGGIDTVEDLRRSLRTAARNGGAAARKALARLSPSNAHLGEPSTNRAYGDHRQHMTAVRRHPYVDVERWIAELAARLGGRLPESCR